MKEFDVHFNLFFSDCLCSIMANTKEEAIENAKNILKDALLHRIDYLIGLGDGDGFELQFTDILEVGKDI